MLKQITLHHFKAFQRITVNFKESNYLVGPNGAGKSTILSALRLAESCLRLAKRSSARIAGKHNGLWVNAAYQVPSKDFESLIESVRHEFHNKESYFELTWTAGHKMCAVWPEVEDINEPTSPFFYLQQSNALMLRTPTEVRRLYPAIGVVPTLSPLEHEEQILNDDYVRSNYSSRLSSRHFRNQLRILNDEGRWDEFMQFAAPWLGGIDLRRPVCHRFGGDESSIDIFYVEPGSRNEREIVWAGDGVQIWVQLVLHLFRARGLPTLILDEPEVFLHADLQRRLVRLLNALDTQVVLATHSSEVLAEASRASIIWVDKSRRRAIRSPRDEELPGLDAALGSAFNLGLARALRARGVLFVEGKDLKILKILAGRVGATRMIEEVSLAIIPINGYSNWSHVEPFAWFAKAFFQDSVQAMIILDRDYRTDGQVADVEARLRNAGIKPHVWQRKELESYLLIPSAISRLTQCPEHHIKVAIDEAMDSLKYDVHASFLYDAQKAERSGDRHVVSIARKYMPIFDRNWLDRAFRLASCPPKEVLGKLNAYLQGNHFKAVSFEAIAKAVQVDEIPSEMRRVLFEIDALAD
ncbi:ATP-dependent nuclease [Nonomuraea sp. NPDC003214]